MIMRFIKNDIHEEIPLGDGEGCVFFDVHTGNTMVLDEVAIDVLDCFKMERDPENVIHQLSKKYLAERSTIESDVNEFIYKLLQNGLLKVVEEEK